MTSIVSWVKEADLKSTIHAIFVIFFFSLQSMGIISWPIVFIRVQYLIIFDFQNDSFFWTYFVITNFFWPTYGAPAPKSQR
jgi:hypothetical protein